MIRDFTRVACLFPHQYILHIHCNILNPSSKWGFSDFTSCHMFLLDCEVKNGMCAMKGSRIGSMWNPMPITVHFSRATYMLSFSGHAFAPGQNTDRDTLLT